jgi:hypothetical protein
MWVSLRCFEIYLDCYSGVVSARIQRFFNHGISGEILFVVQEPPILFMRSTEPTDRTGMANAISFSHATLPPAPRHLEGPGSTPWAYDRHALPAT